MPDIQQSRLCLPFQRRYIRTLLHLSVPLFASLTILFLLLPGITGPQTGSYWVEVDYGSQTGVWRLGALGSCGLGKSCTTEETNDIQPKHWKTVHNALMFHLASAVTFFLVACYASILLHFPESPTTKRYGTLVPLFGPVFPCVVMIVDIAVAHRMETLNDVESIRRIGVYWLGTGSFISSVLWCILIEYDGNLKHREAGDENAIYESDDEMKKGHGSTTVKQQILDGISQLRSIRPPFQRDKDGKRGEKT